LVKCEQRAAAAAIENTNHESTKDENTKKKGRTDMSHEFEALSWRIIEAALAVHKALGPGFLESVYQRAMEVALRHREIPIIEQKEIPVFFEEENVGLHRLDLVVSDQIVVELKAVKALEDIHYAQVKSYLKATGLHVGLLLNFNAPTLVIKRIVL
jgi:GxxExxY protein